MDEPVGRRLGRATWKAPPAPPSRAVQCVGGRSAAADTETSRQCWVPPVPSGGRRQKRCAAWRTPRRAQPAQRLHAAIPAASLAVRRRCPSPPMDTLRCCRHRHRRAAAGAAPAPSRAHAARHHESASGVTAAPHRLAPRHRPAPRLGGAWRWRRVRRRPSHAEPRAPRHPLPR